MCELHVVIGKLFIVLQQLLIVSQYVFFLFAIWDLINAHYN